MTEKDYEDLLGCLTRHGVRALIVGAHAVALHAKPRYTKDIDILVEPTPENAARLIAALDAFGLGNIGLSAEDFITKGRIVQLGYPPNRIDLITSISGVSFEEAWGGRVEAQYGSTNFFFLGKDELIKNKRAAARPQDLADLAWLEE